MEWLNFLKEDGRFLKVEKDDDERFIYSFEKIPSKHYPRAKIYVPTDPSYPMSWTFHSENLLSGSENINKELIQTQVWFQKLVNKTQKEVNKRYRIKRIFLKDA